jgi:23S rRNA-/tRNA-specific pseudouridylate synthase
MTRPSLRWVVEQDVTRLRVVLDELGPEVESALADGRVFVDGKRVRDAEQPLGRGSRVEVFPARLTSSEVSVLGVHGGLVAVYKPAQIATEPDRSGGTTLLSETARLIECQVSELHALSRLDVGVSGVVLLARKSDATVAFERYERKYVAITTSAPEQESGAWSTALQHRSRGLQPAQTEYAILARAAGVGLRLPRSDPSPLQPALLELRPITGRTHQLRLHTAGAGVTILGDRKYGGVSRLIRADGRVLELDRIALHAAAISVSMGSGSAFVVEAPLPPELLELWRQLGGRDCDWTRVSAPR